MKQLKENRRRAVHIDGIAYTLKQANALAVEHYNQKNYRAAAEVYHQIIGQEPEIVETYNNLGCVLRVLGRNNDALAIFDRVLNIKADYILALNNRGIILQDLKRYPEALSTYNKVISLNPDYAEAHANRAVALHSMGRDTDALASFDKAITLNPDYEMAHNNRSIILQAQKYYIEALASCDHVLSINPASAEACNTRGDLLVSMGHIGEAEQMFLRALEIRPGFSTAWYALTSIRTYRDANHADSKAIQNLLSNPNLPSGDKDLLLFALGKIYSDCGLYDEAFECFRLANQLSNVSAFYDPVKVTAYINNLIEVFTKEFLAQDFEFASESKSPLFIVGMPRSGTTLLANILSNHRSIAIAGELNTIKGYTSAAQKMLDTAIPYPQLVKEINASAAFFMTNEYERQLRQDIPAGTPYIIDSNPFNYLNLGFIAMLFPKAKIIHCTRNPLDTCLSNYFQLFNMNYNYSFDLRNIAHYYGEYNRLMEHWHKVLPANRMLEISYEDMTQNTEPTIRGALDFIGLKWEERCLSPHTNPCTVAAASKWQVRQPIYTHSVGRWKHYEKHLLPLKEILRSAEVDF